MRATNQLVGYRVLGRGGRALPGDDCERHPGDRKYINIEAPRAISGVRCTDCNTAFEGLRSFKCHNWAYAVGDLLDVAASMKQAIESR